MRRIIYNQLTALTVLISVMGCAATSTPNNPLSTVDRGLSTIESAAQSGRQVLDAGTAAASTTGINQIGLVDILVHRLNISPQQALGGAGAIFQMAQGNMNPQAFATLSKSVPGMDSMLNAAPAMSNLSGGLSSLMGDNSNALGNVTALAASFQQLNLSPDMVSQFIPIVTNYVSKTSGQATANLLQSALTAR
ncbi:MAG: DUF2780 domain-containing protein [Nitrosomonas sp.]|jgi:hypothetical protein|uniref:DUF2780 domain-containing protein n=1 Tax=Nitrosomonas sp. TaxID=42353 RepID=UPI00273047C9|nr:DUF2780 domain-containing protein [Nitrosomonas sp.]MDP1548883.1 DUF2780 domain-containing protein [Nitrosomonas sp.]